MLQTNFRINQCSHCICQQGGFRKECWYPHYTETFDFIALRCAARNIKVWNLYFKGSLGVKKTFISVFGEHCQYVLQYVLYVLYHVFCYFIISHLVFFQNTSWMLFEDYKVILPKLYLLHYIKHYLENTILYNVLKYLNKWLLN